MFTYLSSVLSVPSHTSRLHMIARPVVQKESLAMTDQQAERTSEIKEPGVSRRAINVCIDTRHADSGRGRAES
jgi:hypothetical protein